MWVENSRGKNCLLTVLLFLLMLVATPASAIGVWLNGFVTSAPYLDRHHHIGIDGVDYLIMPKISIYFPDGAFVDLEGKRLSQQLLRIKPGNAINVKAEGFTIYEIVIGK